MAAGLGSAARGAVDGSIPFLSVAEAAEDLHVTERFIRKLIANGDLRAVKVGTRLVRIRREDLDALIHPMSVGR